MARRITNIKENYISRAHKGGALTIKAGVKTKKNQEIRDFKVSASWHVKRNFK